MSVSGSSCVSFTACWPAGLTPFSASPLVLVYIYIAGERAPPLARLAIVIL